MTGPVSIVGIGGSAGGLEAYQALFEALPPTTGLAFVVVAHMSPAGESLLVRILSWSTPMPVSEAAEAMSMEPNHIYVIAPNSDLLIKDGRFQVLSPRTMTHGHHNQVDQFLTSLADAAGERAISVILSGGDGDGTEGSRQIKLRGGTTFAQDLSAQVKDMPLHALQSGCVDFVLPPKEIAEALTKIAARYQSLALVGTAEGPRFIRDP